MEQKRTKTTITYLLIGFLSVLLFSSNAFAAKKKEQKVDFLDSLETINVETALNELEEIEENLAEENMFIEGNRYISKEELDSLLVKILREESI